MLKLLSRQKIELAGLDVGSSAVKLVRLSKNDGSYKLITAVSEPIAPCQDDDEKLQNQNYVDAIKACMNKAGLKSKNVDL